MNNKIFIIKISLTFGDHVGELKFFNMETFLVFRKSKLNKGKWKWMK